MFTGRLFHRLGAAYWALVHGARARGRPFAREQWEQQYSEGAWDYLGSPEHLGHYALIAAYVQHLYPSPRVLDVGCGAGQLLQLLSRLPLRSYLGVDISAEAIARARALAVPNTSFEVADVEQWRPPGEFDAIILAESLYYLRHPHRFLLEYAHALNEHGAFIVSMYRYKNTRLIWRRIEKHFPVRYATRVENRARQVWDVKVLQRAG